MYVCICNGYSESQIRNAARTGLRTVQEIYMHLGKPVRCGRCLEVAAKLIEETRADARAVQEQDAA